MKLRDTFKKTALWAGAFGLLFGLLGWASWWLTVPQLYMLRSMPATAFMLCGTALLLLCSARRWWRWLGRGTALLVFLACASSLVLQRAGSTGSGILSDSPYQAVIALLFGTMSLYDIIGFALLSLSIALIDLRRGSLIVPSEWFAGCGFMMAIMAGLGTLFEQARFCLFISCQELSLLAVAAYGLLCGGVLMSRTETGMMNIMETPGAGGMTARRILPGALVIPIVLGLLRVVSVKFHLWDAETALPIAVLLMISAFIILIWTSSLKLEKKDNQLKDTMRGLEQSEQRVRTIIHESVDAFVAIDKSGRVHEWSNRAQSMFGIERNEALQAPVHSFLTEPVQVRLLAYFEATDAARSLAEGELEGEALISGTSINPMFHARVPRPDGVTIDIEVMPFIIEANQEKLCCAFIRDVTQRKQLEQRFQDFYHAVSHELRSPLTAIRCSLQSVNETQGDALDENASKQLHNAIGASDRLIQLINDLLDLRRIELGKFSFDSAVADPILLAQAAVDTLTPLSNLKSLAVILLVESAQQVVCDPARTEQVLINLLSNAIKFAPARGQILVRVSDCEERVRFAVSDHGPGIPEHQASRLFESFEQLQSPGWEYIPGTGLGLAISRRIVEELGGTIGHTNNEPTGSTFWFELLAAPSDAAIGLPHKSGSAVQSAPGARRRAL